MQRFKSVSMLLAVILLLAGCSEDRGINPADPAERGTPAMSADPELIAREIAAAAGWTAVTEEGDERALEGVSSCYLGEFDRQELVGDVVHYSFQVDVGPGPWDVIGIHRVVREARPYRPIRARKNLFMAHGDGADFMAAFMTSVLSPSTPDEHALSVFLAMNDVDVWGIDFGWTFVPAGTADFSFMQGWGMEKEAEHLGIALAVARAARVLTGSGPGKMNLLAWSSGATAGYVYLNNETQVPESFRNVKGFIPVEGNVKFADEDAIQTACAEGAALQAMIDSGMYQDETGMLAQTLAVLAMTAPDDPSPVVPGLTNFQAVLFIGSATWNIAAPLPYYHLVAGVFNEYGIPVGLQYTTVPLFIDFAAAWSPYAPNQRQLDIKNAACGQVDVPFDDHLGEVTVPVFYIGAGGGVGEYGVYTTTLLGSTDVTTLVIDFAPPEARMLDFGHVDVFQATDAPTLVWEPILDWIVEHEKKHGKRHAHRM